MHDGGGDRARSVLFLLCTYIFIIARTCAPVSQESLLLSKYHCTSLYPVHLSQGSRYTNPIPSKTFLSASFQSRHLVFGSLHPSKSTQVPVPLWRTPLLSNFQPLTRFAYRLRSLWNVVPDVHPATAQPTVRHGLMMISTRRCRLGFLALGSASRSAALLGQLGSCHTTSALSRVSKP